MFPSGRYTDVQALAQALGVTLQELPVVLAYSHGRTCAEKITYRVVHGVEGDNNMGILAQNLDNGYWSTQGRTAPAHGMRPFWNGWGAIGAPVPTYLYRHENRNHIKVLEAISPEAAEIFKKEAYPIEKDIAWLRATGLKNDVIEHLLETDFELVTRFRKVMMHGSKFFNSGPLYLSKESPEMTSIMDVINLLRFVSQRAVEGGLTDAVIEDLLAFSPGQEQSLCDIDDPKVAKYYVGSEAEGRAIMSQFISAFAEVYPELMRRAGATAVAKGTYPSLEAFWTGTSARAEAMGRPMDKMYRHNLHARADSAEALYLATGDTSLIAEVIDGDSADSLRNLDALHRQSPAYRSGETTVTQQRIRSGVEYAVAATDDGARHLKVSLLLKAEKNGYRTPEGTFLTRKQLDGLQFAFQQAPRGAQQSLHAGVLEAREPGVAALTFICPVQTYDTMHVRGQFELAGQRLKSCYGYVYSVPDAADVAELLGAPAL